MSDTDTSTDPETGADPQEADRLAALSRYGILDTPPEPAFDDAVALVKTICRVPIALVSFVAAQRQWFKARIGVDAHETALDTSVCALAIRQGEPFVIEDLAADPRTAGMSLVTGAPHIRFYAGMPLVTGDGHALGSLCAIDTAPRPGGLDAEQLAALRAVARQVVALIELRCAVGQRDRAIVEQGRRQDQATRDAAVLETILEAQRQVAQAGGSFDASLQAFVDAALEAVPPADGAVVEMRFDDRLVYRSASGTSAPHVGLELPIEGSFSGASLRGGSTLVTADALRDERSDRATVERLGIRSMIVVPLSRRGEAFGVLKLQSREPDMFHSRHILTAQMIAGLIAGGFTESAEAAALRSAEHVEQRYRAIIDSAIDTAIISTDESGQVTSWSAGAEHILGWSEQEMIGRPLATIFVAEDRAAARPATELARAAREGRALDERWHQRKDGSRFYAHGTVTPLVGEGRSGFVKSLRDITADHETREALDRSRERLELASHAAGLGNFDYHPDADALEWDDRCRALFGLPPGAPVGYEETFLRGLHPDDRDAAATAVAASLDPAGTGKFRTEYRTIGIVDGIERAVAAEGQAFFDKGRPVRLIGTVRDVTADRAARLALRETEERLRYAVAATNDAIWDWDLRIDNVRWNEAIETVYGHRLADVAPVGSWWMDHIHPDDRARIDHGLHAVIAGDGTEWSAEYRFTRADGSFADVFDRGSVIRDEDGRPIRMIGAIQDLTERKRMERELQSRAERLAADIASTMAERDRLWKASPDLLAIVDFEGMIGEMNPAWHDILGIDVAATIGTNITDLIHPDDLPATRAALGSAAEGPLPIMENRLCHADGGHRWISWVAAPFEGLIYATGRHVTAEKEAQETLRRTEDALRQAQKVEAVGQLTGGVAHDFNNLLTVIRGSVDLLKRPNISEEKRRRYIDAISDTTDRATRLTAQLLAFARRQALKPQVFDAGANITALREMLGTLTGSRIRLHLSACATPCHVNADPSQFDTAIVNMAVNARDAMGGEGDLTIAVATVAAMPAIRNHPAVPGDYVAVAITDTGSGIAADQIEHIFEPFFSTKSVGEGTGLGLSQVFGFAKQSGGEIHVASAPGEGSTFTLYLPLVAPDEQAAAADGPDTARPARPGGCVLVVEDNEEVGRFATQALAELGFGTEWAATADEALALVAATPDRFDIVFTDVIMPGKSGIELARELRTLLPALPIVLTSGYSAVLAAQGTGGFDLLQKPYSIDELSRILRKAVG
ncbi:PAS domain S-box protein [Sphingomonas profundi]|uniref:PAS domain S-box protein n=1 Tax=Alterirhizorhabdus profundi TaxID=2681549 RepID=UPI0018D01876|nr:PAS domain S-box protein [Sphingomonas profundi]